MNEVNSVHWLRVLATGVLWAVIYNLTWAVAWFTFMRGEWRDAASAIRHSSPWTAEVWTLWVALTLPIGVAIMVYVASQPSSTLKAPLHAAGALWLLMTLGMAIWGVQESLSMRVIMMDSTVNLFSTVTASLAGGWSLRHPLRLEARR